MEYLTEKVKTGRWQWRIRKDSEVTEGSLQHFIDKAGMLVKSNGVREIYAVDGYYVKHENPVCLVGKLINIFFSKACSEFESAILLEKNSIPCAEYCGWGFYRTKTIIFS